MTFNRANISPVKKTPKKTKKKHTQHKTSTYKLVIS